MVSRQLTLGPGSKRHAANRFPRPTNSEIACPPSPRDPRRPAQSTHVTLADTRRDGVTAQGDWGISVSPRPGDWQRLGDGLREPLRVLQPHRMSSVWDHLPPDTHRTEVALQVGLRIAGLALQIPTWHLECAQQGANGRGGSIVHRNGLAMDRSRLNEPSDPEMGCSQTLGLRFGSFDWASSNSLNPRSTN